MDVGVGMMQVEVTNRCNLNCPHCFYYEAGEKGEDYNNFLNLKAMDKLLNDLGIRYIRTLNFTGGEPLLNTEGIIYSLHQILKSNCVVLGIDIPTNGTILEISRMAFEHLYDDIKEVHERLPYLTPEECQEWFDCWKRWSAFQDNKLWNILTFDYVMRGWKLEELNDQREKNMSSLFDYIVLGNQEGKIKDGSE